MISSQLKNFWQIITLSFYSTELYLNVANQWKHWGLKLLLHFSLLVSVICSLMLFTFFSQINFDDLKPLLEQIPPLKIENNQASVQDPQIKLPFYIKFPDSKEDFIVVDLDADKNKYAKQNILVFSKDAIFFSEISNTPMAYSAIAIDGTVNGEILTELLKKAQTKILNIILFLGVPLGSLIYFISMLLKSYLYAAIANLVAKILKYNLNFKQLTRLAILANIPAFFIMTLIALMFFGGGLGLVAQMIAENIYLFYFTYIFIVCGRRSATIK